MLVPPVPWRKADLGAHLTVRAAVMRTREQRANMRLLDEADRRAAAGGLGCQQVGPRPGAPPGPGFGHGQLEQILDCRRTGDLHPAGCCACGPRAAAAACLGEASSPGCRLHITAGVPGAERAGGAAVAHQCPRAGGGGGRLGGRRRHCGPAAARGRRGAA